MTQGRITIFKSERPAILGKTYRLTPDGHLTKETAGQMSRGTYRVAGFDGAQELADLLQTIGNNEAISASLPASGAVAGVVVAEKLVAATPGAVTRSKRCFTLPDAPGLLTLDYDVEDGTPTLTPSALWSSLLAVAPALAGAGVVHWHSGSSFIFKGEDELKGLGGQRLYVMAASLADAPRALMTLNKRLWLAGVGGHVKVSSSGALLVRSLFDPAMGDSGARMDFIGGAICAKPLEQRRGAPRVLADGGFIDTRMAIPDLTSDEEAAHIALVETAKHVARPDADAQRQRWKSEHMSKAVARAVAEGAGGDLEQLRQLVGRTLESALGGVLVGSFPLVLVDDKGKEQAVTVEQVLSDRPRYHLSRFLSPLNPEHRNRTPDAILYADQPQPCLYDLDEGGTLYRLAAQPVRLQVAVGGRAELAGQIADQLAACPDVLSLGGVLVLAQGAKFCTITKPLLSWLIGHRTALFRQAKDRQSPADVDQQTADMVHALLTHKARSIKGRSTLPLIDLAGRVIDRPGLDETTGIYLDIKPGEWPAVPITPCRIETVNALRRLWAPWAAYRWASPDDRAAMLATVLTVALRPTIDSAPGLFADAPLQASGKSKAVGAVAALVEGRKVAVKPWVSGNEAEVEKWALSVARSGAAAVVLDNIVGTFDSACPPMATSNSPTYGHPNSPRQDSRIMSRQRC